MAGAVFFGFNIHLSLSAVFNSDFQFCHDNSFLLPCAFYQNRFPHSFIAYISARCFLISSDSFPEGACRASNAQDWFCLNRSHRDWFCFVRSSLPVFPPALVKK